MKCIAYFLFLLLLFSSCDGCRPANYAHVEFRDSSSGNFLLQSFSDSTLRLLNFFNDSIKVVPFHNIRRFFLQGDEIDLNTPEGKARLQKSLEVKILW
jgi:hypothetical protein